ncbi:MAG: LapA family protein [Alphaproteobacteria bacterium]|nr:LapA family protein [Alphaproteobacteria bacterium]
MRLLSWIIGLPVAIALVVFAVANRQIVPVDLFPLPIAAELPVYLVVLGALLAGFLMGLLAAWIAGHRHRAKARAEARRAAHLEREVDRLAPPTEPGQS